ncbi:MAG: TlpA disulfide reductase family protein, partial [Thermodesulfobacteriota bacterium]
MDKVEDKAIVEADSGEEKTGKGLIKFLIWGPVIALLLIAAGAMLTREGEVENRRPQIGDPARDFTYPDLDGRPVTLSSFYGKKVVYVNIWATWCTSCRFELPTVQAMYKKFKGDDFEVLAVSIDALGKKAIVPFMKELGLTFPALQDITGSIQALYGATGVPESFIVDKRGRIALVEVGPGDWREPDKQAFIKSLMDEPDVDITEIEIMENYKDE